jgi:hypothetical protein
VACSGKCCVRPRIPQGKRDPTPGGGCVQLRLLAIHSVMLPLHSGRPLAPCIPVALSRSVVPKSYSGAAPSWSR